MCVKRVEQFSGLLRNRIQEIPIEDGLHHGQAGGTCNRMPKVRVTMLEKPRPLTNGLIDASGAKHCTDRLIARAQAFRYAQDIWSYVIGLAGKQVPSPAHAAHHFIQDQQYPVWCCQTNENSHQIAGAA